MKPNYERYVKVVNYFIHRYYRQPLFQNKLAVIECKAWLRYVGNRNLI
jgi:hypothetical protein